MHKSCNVMVISDEIEVATIATDPGIDEATMRLKQRLYRHSNHV